MVSSQLLCTTMLAPSNSCGSERTLFFSTLNPNRYCRMHFPLNVLLVSNAVAVHLWVYFILLATASCSVASAVPPRSSAISSAVYARLTRYQATHHGFKVAAFPSEPSVLAHGHAVRISVSDLQSRRALERANQLAAFQQFDRHRTGEIYNVSAPGLPMGDVRAIRLRSGSFRRYGVNINEVSIPQGCIVDPIPERILLVYARFLDTSIFQAVPEGFVLASPVVSILVYDAGNLTSDDVPRQLSVSTTESAISIRLPQSSGAKCALFASDSTAVNVTDSARGVCEVNHFGAFALVAEASAPAPSPARQQSPASSRHKHSNTWKIVVGSVVGGLALLALLGLLALCIRKRRRDSKLSRMEHQAEQGETLQMATVRNLRVPAAANTRTQATLVNDYSI